MKQPGSILRNSISGAAIIAALLLAPTTAEAARCFGKESGDKAGNATAVRGPEVGLRKAGAGDFERPLAGADVFGGDRVRTGAASILQLKLCDWSTYTFSPGSESDINEFYSADGAERRRVVNFLRGGLRLLSGRETGPDDTEVKFEEAGVTMGVRGTGVVVVELDGLIYILLEGPGLDNSGLANPGRVDFTDDERRQILERLTRAGFAVTLGPDGISAPFMPDVDLLRRIYAAFAPSIPSTDDGDGTPPGGGGSPENQSGQGAQEGGVGIQTTQNNGGGGGAYLYTQINNLNAFRSVNPISTIAEIDALGMPSGTFHLDGVELPGFAEFTTAAGVTAVGTATASFDISFANRTIGGGGSFLAIAIDDTLSQISIEISAPVGVISFDDAVGGLGVFVLDSDDFGGGVIDSAFLTLHTSTALPGVVAALGLPPGSSVPAGMGELVFTFSVGAAGEGHGAVTMALQQGLTSAP